MSDTEDVLSSIDAVLNEHDTFDGAIRDDEFPDAMRWVPPDDRTYACDTCLDLGEIRSMVPGSTGEPVEADVECPDCHGARPDEFGEVYVGAEVHGPAGFDLSRPIYHVPEVGWYQPIRAALFHDMLMTGSAFIDARTGERIPPEDAALVRDADGAVTGASIRGQRLNYVVVDEAERLPLTIDRPPGPHPPVQLRAEDGWRDVGWTTMDDILGTAPDDDPVTSWPTPGTSLSFTATAADPVGHAVEWQRRIQDALNARRGEPFDWAMSPEQSARLRERVATGLVRRDSDHMTVQATWSVQTVATPVPGGILARIAQAAAQAATAIRRFGEAFRPVDLPKPNESVRERALRLRQTRNTGPESVPFQNRGRRERRTPPSTPARRRRAGQHVHVPPTRRR